MAEPTQEEKTQEIERSTVDMETLAVLNKSEIDQQIATAKRYPRSIVAFRNEILQLVTLTESIADECLYAVPRDGRPIEGPSVRFAEAAASSWGNCRAGARVVAEERDYVIAQGVFYDLEKNVAINFETKRRITKKDGRRYSADMIGTTGNAACSIALRNAILKGIPKAFWNDAYEAARKTAMGDAKTLVARRADMLAALQKYGVTPQMVFDRLAIKGIEDITLEMLLLLKGIGTAIKEGDTTVEQAFAVDQKPAEKGGAANLESELMSAPKASEAAAVETAREGAAVKIIRICKSLSAFTFDEKQFEKMNMSENTMEEVFGQLNEGELEWFVKSKILIPKGK